MYIKQSYNIWLTPRFIATFSNNLENTLMYLGDFRDKTLPPFPYVLGKKEPISNNNNNNLSTILPCDYPKEKELTKDFKNKCNDIFIRKDFIENKNINLFYPSFIAFAHPNFFESTNFYEKLDNIDTLNFFPLYGRSEEITKILRSDEKKGHLKSSFLKSIDGNNEEHFPFLKNFTNQEIY